MKRALVAIAVIGVLLGIFATSHPPAHAATTCVKHTKRVVKHVKRHGKRKKVVHFRHYWTCQEAATPTTPSPAPTPLPTPTPTPETPVTSTPPPTPAPQPEPEPEANALGVAANDRGGVKSYTLSRQTVRSGRLTVQLQNKGEDPHDMEMQKVGPSGEPLGAPVEVPVTSPGEQKVQSVQVEAGTYRMWCNLYHHAEEGMEATVTVE